MEQQGLGVTVPVLDTLVGRPAPLGTTRRGPVVSAIRKASIGTGSVYLSEINLSGDDQADRSVHGGPDKSVYLYPSEHEVPWREDGFELPAGSVGENVVIAGAREPEVRIGDVWRWGDATMQISQPRAPCFKLALRTGRRDIVRRMILTGRSGWYVRTLEPGPVAPRGSIELLDRDDRSPTVAECFAVMFTGQRSEAADTEIVARVVRCPTLAPEWLGYLRAHNQIAARL
jgi:MOSC domain-containing protein YiiM